MNAAYCGEYVIDVINIHTIIGVVWYVAQVLLKNAACAKQRVTYVIVWLLER